MSGHFQLTRTQEHHHPRLQRIPPSTMDLPHTDTDGGEFKRFCQYFAYRAEMLSGQGTRGEFMAGRRQHGQRLKDGV